MALLADRRTFTGLFGIPSTNLAVPWAADATRSFVLKLARFAVGICRADDPLLTVLLAAECVFTLLA
jgi:hypothetical protein